MCAQYGLLSSAQCKPTGVPTPSEDRYVKVEWTCGLHPLWILSLRLAFVTRLSLVEFRRALDDATHPRGVSAVPDWLVAMGCEGLAEWRLELELKQPAAGLSIANGLYTHHLIRALDGGTITRVDFLSLYHRDIHPDRCPTPAAVERAFVHRLVAGMCERNEVLCDASTGYPRQPRPHDLTPHNVGLLHQCAVTPKVDGLEAFLVGHAHGVSVVLRSGEVTLHPWRGTPLFPLLLEGELLGNDPLLFVAYDILVSPTLSYFTHGIHWTRQSALALVLRALQSDSLLNAPGIAFVCKPSFELELFPHRAIQQCLDWARATGIPCDVHAPLYQRSMSPASSSRTPFGRGTPRRTGCGS